MQPGVLQQPLAVVKESAEMNSRGHMPHPLMLISSLGLIITGGTFAAFGFVGQHQPYQSAEGVLTAVFGVMLLACAPLQRWNSWAGAATGISAFAVVAALVALLILHPQ